ncbi:STE13 (YOR219C) [Zygosaccharomyces parabailii]|nr:STE13 (YOR219C) [Zygosaccharomyces parabailii]
MSFSHKRKHSHMFLQRKNSSAADMGNYEMDQFAQQRVEGDPQFEQDLEQDIEQDVEDQTLRTRGFMGSWRQKRSLVLLLLGILCILALFGIPFHIARSTPNLKESEKKDSQIKSFGIDTVLEGGFNYEEKTFHFINPPKVLQRHEQDPGLYFTVEKDQDGNLSLLAKQLYDKTYSVLLGKDKFEYEGKEYLVQKVRISYRLDKIILATNVEPEFRHSSYAYYWILDVEKNQVSPISPFPSLQLQKISYAHLSPNFNFAYFVYDNDIYLQSLYNKNSADRITSSGTQNVFHGKPDWIYEEEVLSDEKAVWWCPDDSKMVFAKFDDSEVNTYSFPLYISENRYTSMRDIKYPKPGSFNPKVELYMLDLKSGVISLINAMKSAEGQWGDDYILYDAHWIGPHAFLFKIADRTSTRLIVRVYDTTNNTLRTIYVIDSKSLEGWIEKTKSIVPIPPREDQGRTEYGYADVLPDEKGFNHIFFFPKFSDSKGIQVTKGDWEISGSGIVGYDYETNSLFFMANKIKTMAQHLYSVSLNKEDTHSVRLLQNPEKEDDFYEYELSSSCRYALAKKLGPDVPVTIAGDLFDVLDADTANSEKVLHLTDDKNLRDTLKRHDLPTTSYKTMTLDDGVEVNYVEIKPSVLDSTKKYPILVNTYAGPGSQTYFTKFSVFFEHAVASGLRAIILQIEPRGTGGKGWKFKNWVKGKLGYWEPRDITEVTKKFIKFNEDLVNKEKIAIWGWSYGAFTTLKTIEYDKGNTFSYAMAVAPVTNWTYYDSIYTERYMGMPSENTNGYKNIAVVKDIDAFTKMKRFLIMHGTADENVHIQNSYEFIDHLNNRGIKNYDMQIFPDSDHAIHFHNAHKVIFSKLYEWLEDAFSGRFDD